MSYDKTHAEKELEKVLGVDDKKKFYDVLFSCCGKNWEITVDEVGPDICSTCGEYTDPLYYVEVSDVAPEDIWGE